MKQFLSQLKSDKIKINWNKNPIRMDDFLSFLTVEVTFVSEHLGWTQYKGDNNLIFYGGKVNGTEWLDNIQYGKRLDNPYNNYVSPFYLFGIMTSEGREFFLDYYKEEIDGLIDKKGLAIKCAEHKLEEMKLEHLETVNFFKKLRKA